MQQPAQGIPGDYWQKWRKTQCLPSPSSMLKLTGSLFPNCPLIIQNAQKNIQEHLTTLSLDQHTAGKALNP